MSLFNRKKKTQPAAPPPRLDDPAAAAPPPVTPAPAGDPANTSLKLDLPDIFAFNQDETRSLDRRPAADDETSHGRGTVLLVETDPEVCRLISRLLTHEGYELLTASCLAEARETLKQARVDKLLARRACVPRNHQSEVALRELESKCEVRVVDEFSDLMLGQVINYEALSQCFLGLLDLTTSLLEGANLGVRGHAHNTAKYCRMVGQRLGLSRRDLDALTLAAYLHDLGLLEPQDPTAAPGSLPAAQLPDSFQPTLDLLANVSFPYPIENLLVAATAPVRPAVDSDDAKALCPSGTSRGARVLRVVDAYETFRRDKDRFPDEETLFDWLRQQPDGKYDVDALESLIHIRKHEQAINAMNIFWAAILIVDPQPDDVQLLRLRLENDDLHLHLATSIEEALRVLRNENITLVLSEYDLANKTTGFELLRTMKNDPEMRTIPFVFHAEPDTTLIKQALEAGAEDWYPKISNIEITAMKLERIAGRRHDNATAAGNGVQGSLAEMGLIEMVQILSQGGRSVQIIIERAQDHGELILHKGLVISAARGELVGEAAAYDILRWQDGRFQILPLKKPPTPNITTSTDNLILNSCLQEDIRYQQATHGHDQPAVSEQAG